MLSRFFSIAVILFIGFLSTESTQAMQATVTPAFRGYPMYGYLTGTINQEGILWDHRTESDPYQYSLWQFSIMGDVNGAVELAANYYPISFLRFTGALGGAYRYFNSTAFNCSVVYCSGFLTRNRLGVGFLIVTGENKEWSIIPEYNLIFVSSGQTQNANGDEQELLIASAPNDTLDRYQVKVWKKFENQYYGLLARRAEFRGTGLHNELQAVVSKTIWRDTTFEFGAGRYASDLYVPGFTVFASYEWRWGYTQSLF